MNCGKNLSVLAVVVAQLVERSQSIPEVRGSNPVIGKHLYWTFYCQLHWKDENKETSWKFESPQNLDVGR